MIRVERTGRRRIETRRNFALHLGSHGCGVITEGQRMGYRCFTRALFVRCLSFLIPHTGRWYGYWISGLHGMLWLSWARLERNDWRGLVYGASLLWIPDAAQ